MEDSLEKSLTEYSREEESQKLLNSQAPETQQPLTEGGVR